MHKIIHWFSASAIQAFAFVSIVAIAQEIPISPQQKNTPKICSFNTVENLLPPIASQQSSSLFAYLGQQGFVQDSDGSWVCYVSDSKKEWRYYTLFKVQQIGEKLIATSFIENGNWIDGQETRSLDLFMTLIEKHIRTTDGNRQSIRNYLATFISLVKQGKVPPLPRGYLFDQPHRGFVSYHSLTSGKFQGTAITININILK
ncbi:MULTISPECIES: aminotransferase class IV [Nostocales]|uniref:Uncharacterized protein n=3 Tax=Nostocales TaxID=1161 RepID=A0A0C1R3E3_9CYAN|nr:hypothetical protein [Tolypothrix bouteillei]KAF3889824.1 hypothetical protein DA73_0400033410 [Tolypothrix bouteillei VB521301]